MLNLSRREFIERPSSIGLGLGLSSVIGDMVFNGDAHGANTFKRGGAFDYSRYSRLYQP